MSFNENRTTIEVDEDTEAGLENRTAEQEESKQEMKASKAEEEGEVRLTRSSLALQPSSRRDLNFRKKFSASFILVIVSSLMLADHYSTSFLVQQKVFYLLNASLTTL